MSLPFASSQRAHGYCDRCGFRYPLRRMVELVIKTKKVNILVCPECWEPDHPQLLLGMQPVLDPQALRNPRPDNTYYEPSGSRVIYWGWNPVGYNESPSTLVAQGAVGTVTVSTESL